MIDPRKVWSSSQLPTLPTAAMRLLELARDPEADFRDVIQVVKTDPATTAKILKAANSSFFGFKAPVTSIERAVPLLGTTVVTTLALSFSLVDGAMSSGPLSHHYSAYWKQSIVQAVAAEVLAEQRALGLPSECFLMGLLLDLGRLAMLKTVPEDYVQVLESWDATKTSLVDAELAAMGIDHAAIGVQLMQDWKLPPRLVSVAAIHHAPVNELIDRLSAQADLERIIAMAAAAGDYFCTGAKGAALERMKALSAAFYNLPSQALEEYLERTRERIDRAGNLFSVDFGELGTAGEFLAQANEQLVQMVVREHMVSTQLEIQRKAIEQTNQELTSKNQELQERAARDPLTGLYNRAFFNQALCAAIEAATQSASLVGVVFSDIDLFKRLNDTYGHLFGDEVLRGVAGIHSQVLRKTDVIARYGGEEFVVLVHQPTEVGLEKLADRLRGSIAAAAFSHEEKSIGVTVSIGAAIVLPERDSNDLARRLVAAADEAMYESKQNGRNQCRFRSLIDPADRRLAQLVSERRFSRWLLKNGAIDVPSISRGILGMPSERVRLGSLAQLLGLLTGPQIEDIRRNQETTGKRFGNCALARGHLKEDQLAVLLAIQAEPPNLLARTLTSMGLFDQARADELLGQYREFLDHSAALVVVV